MSVTGEFRRLVTHCIEFLESSESGAVIPWANRLHAARAIAANDLSAAAEKVLALDAGDEGIGHAEFSTAADTEDFRERWEHLLAVARVITGAGNA